MALTDAQAGGSILEYTDKLRVLLAGDASRGDLLGFASGWKRALATVGTAIQGRLIALEDGLSGETINAVASAVITGRITGATPGGAVYGEEGTGNGKYTEVAPATTGDVNKIIGYVIDATTIRVEPMMRADSVSP